MCWGLPDELVGWKGLPTPKAATTRSASCFRVLEVAVPGFFESLSASSHQWAYKFFGLVNCNFLGLVVYVIWYISFLFEHTPVVTSICMKHSTETAGLQPRPNWLSSLLLALLFFYSFPRLPICSFLRQKSPVSPFPVVPYAHTAWYNSTKYVGVLRFSYKCFAIVQHVRTLTIWAVIRVSPGGRAPIGLLMVLLLFPPA